MSMQVMRSGGYNADLDTSSPRVYFLTDTKFYEMMFSWSDPEGDRQAGKEMSDWQTMLLSGLHELPMDGFELTLMADNVHDGNSSLLHLSSRLREYQGIRCEPTRVGEMDLSLPKPVLFVVPCFTTVEIHNRMEAEGDGWHYGDYLQYYTGKASPPPQPASEPLTDEERVPLFDVMPISRRWGERIAPKTRLTWPQVDALIQQADDAGGCIALRYYAEPYPPEGKACDSLEWLNIANHLPLIGPGELPMIPVLKGPADEG